MPGNTSLPQITRQVSAGSVVLADCTCPWDSILCDVLQLRQKYLCLYSWSVYMLGAGSIRPVLLCTMAGLVFRMAASMYD